MTKKIRLGFLNDKKKARMKHLVNSLNGMRMFDNFVLQCLYFDVIFTTASFWDHKHEKKNNNNNKNKE